MKQLLPQPHPHRLKKTFTPPFTGHTITIEALKNGRPDQILQCLKKHMLGPDKRVLQELKEQLDRAERNSL
ncbi:MAG TPA: hypothetical protein VFL76_02705 [Edaphocola sp.]|nr:hypothetical protein [Edaphocola sp.]